jgi:succinate dehydrogenase / fumarate reductase cytochrome b subunit
MNQFVRKHYFLIRRLHSLLGVVPIGLFFLMHMFLNSRAAQSPQQYQWVPDTLDQVPYLWAIEIFGILVPILFHAVLGVLIALQSDYGGPTKVRSFGANMAYIFQRVTGIFLFGAITWHVWTTWWVHKRQAMEGSEFEIYKHMNGILQNPVELGFYVLFVLIAAWHFGNGVFNFCYKWGVTTSAASQRWAILAGYAFGLLGVIMGLASIWGLRFAPWASEIGG